MDKLAMEEAGFRNCVSVPDGAPPSVSTKDLPPEEKVFSLVKILNYLPWCGLHQGKKRTEEAN